MSFKAQFLWNCSKGFSPFETFSPSINPFDNGYQASIIWLQYLWRLQSLGFIWSSFTRFQYLWMLHIASMPLNLLWNALINLKLLHPDVIPLKQLHQILIHLKLVNFNLIPLKLICPMMLLEEREDVRVVSVPPSLRAPDVRVNPHLESHLIIIGHVWVKLESCDLLHILHCSTELLSKPFCIL